MYRHVMGKDEEHILRKVLNGFIPGKIGRPKTRWKGVKSTGLSARRTLLNFQAERCER